VELSATATVILSFCRWLAPRLGKIEDEGKMPERSMDHAPYYVYQRTSNAADTS
jgi:hypothetical protein